MKKTLLPGHVARVTNHTLKSQFILVMCYLLGSPFQTPATADTSPLNVAVDVMPGRCPNILNVKSRSLLSVAVFGGNGLNVRQVDLATVRLSEVDGIGTLGASIAPGKTVGSVAPVASLSKFRFLPTSYQNQDLLRNCETLVNAGQEDLVLQFRVADVVKALGLASLPNGATVPLAVTGNLVGGGTFSSVGSPDFVTLLSPGAPVVTILGGKDLILDAPATRLHLTAGASGNPTSFQWCQVNGLESGVGEVTFLNPTGKSTDAVFNTAGQYLLTFTASNLSGSGQATIRVTVNLDKNGTGILAPDSIADRLAATYPPDHNTAFLTFGGNNQGNDTTAASYYTAIDPHCKKKTFADWLIANEMNDPNLVVVADYFNAIDLGFGRHMVMAKNRRAFVVTNYRTVDDAIDDVNPIAAVAMEYGPPDDDPTGAPFTKFFVYNAQTGARLTSADLDGGKNKAVPGLCIVCHGGRDTPTDYATKKGNVNAHFLPFDLNAFEYSCDSKFTRKAQEGVFKQLNQGVLEIEAGTATSPANLDFNNPPQPMTTLITLIEGWYGLNTFTTPAPQTLPYAEQYSEFIPPGWAGHDNLYLGVVAQSCRNCHSTRPSAFNSNSPALNFARFDDFDGFAHPNGGLIRGFVNGNLMPQAHRTFERFWLSTSALPQASSPKARLPQADLLERFLNQENIE